MQKVHKNSSKVTNNVLTLQQFCEIMHLKKYFYIISCAFMVASCSSTKYVDDGSFLLNKVEMKTDGTYPDINISQLKGYVRQKSNSQWFSAVKIPLHTYSLSGRDTSKWINRTLKSMGEAPVIFDSTATARTCEDLRLALCNKGYLMAYVEATTKTKGKKKVNVTYTLHPGLPYHIRLIRRDIRDTAIAHIIGDDTHSLLSEGMQFDANKLDEERKRIVNALTDNGYYRFHKDYITFQAENIADSRDIDVAMVLHQYVLNHDSIADHPRYDIGKVTYTSGNPDDSLLHIRPSVMRANTLIRQGQPYSASDLRNTYNRFGRLQAVKYTNINFHDNDSLHTLDCNIQLTPNKPNSISFEPEGTNTAGDLGAAMALTYQNRNLFRGSEVLSIQLRGAYEAITGLEGYSNQDFIEYSVEASLSFPRIIAPFGLHKFTSLSNTQSEVSVMYDMQNRPEYHRRVLSMAWKYKWANTGHHDRYQLDILDINYLFMPWISDTFRKDYLEDDNNKNAILRYNYENLLIMKFGFGYSYNNGIYAIKANVETSGNLLGLCSGIFNFSKNNNGQYKVFDIAYAQYAKADIDLTRNILFDDNHQLVMHLGFGIAYPYGNSTILPFEKRYFSGGANSVRGWSVRELGPGKFKGHNGQIDFINQTGDMKLDINFEYRAPLFWKLTGALFVDAGNIWTLRNYDDQPGGQFKFDEFWKQIAVGYGLGFRLNFDYFILRFDMGMKAVNPAYEADGGKHYPITSPNFSRDFTFHFAVGLPF